MLTTVEFADINTMFSNTHIEELHRGWGKGREGGREGGKEGGRVVVYILYNCVSLLVALVYCHILRLLYYCLYFAIKNTNRMLGYTSIEKKFSINSISACYNVIW